MLQRSALPAVALLTSFTIFAVIWTYISPSTTSSGHTYAFAEHSRAWWGTSRVAPSPTWTAAQIYNANADQQRGSSSFSSLNAIDITPSLGDPQAQDSAEARSAQPQDDISRRCKYTLGEWCRQALSVNRTTAATPHSFGQKGCTAACNIVGNCNADTGVCDCPAGEATMVLCRSYHFISALFELHTLPLCPLSRMTSVPVSDKGPAKSFR